MIRDINEEDISRILEIYSYYVINTAISFEYKVPTYLEFKERIENITKQYPYLIIEKDGIVEGYCYASKLSPREAYNHSCEVSIYINKDARQKGLGKTLYKELEKRLKKQGITNLYACIAYPNKEDKYLTYDSINFHKHVGYTEVGKFHNCGYKFKQWYNIIWMEKIIDEHKIY